MKNNIIVCTVKPYEIEMDDGEKLTVKLEGKEINLNDGAFQKNME